MRKSKRNLSVIQNFILHITHCNGNEEDEFIKEHITLTPKIMYKAAEDYIEEDHVDGKDNPEDFANFEGVITEINKIGNDDLYEISMSINGASFSSDSLAAKEEIKRRFGLTDNEFKSLLK